ncbi:MAG TPA: GDP-mannose 4,6-dehydratase, partial [Leptospiraceae bacterium]|nr:GDP-mannose 4,6-dehydratase [Leptospiraceae bacterium]
MKNNRKLQNMLVTGGAGFIGANFIQYAAKKGHKGRIVNLDALTYAADLAHLNGIESRLNYTFIHGNILDRNLLRKVFSEYEIDTVVHFAAESHVDNSIESPDIFIKT